ncbi:MAG: leucine-rich repeat domain-containing protein [Muribaculaceae bacterium]|nr:leucine-rich repeat domain-containing protein [Muribaculaceae bacterium]
MMQGIAKASRRGTSEEFGTTLFFYIYLPGHGCHPSKETNQKIQNMKSANKGHFALSPVFLPLLFMVAIPSHAEVEQVIIDDIVYLVDTEISEAIVAEQPTELRKNNLVISDFINYGSKDYPVTALAENAFYNCEGLNGSLTIGNNVKSIGKYAFWYCTNLTGSLTIGNSVTHIGACAFGFTGFSGSLILPDVLEYIGYGAFQNCSGFTGPLTIPNKVSEIGNGAFSRCSGFTEGLTIPNSISEIEPFIFEGCAGLTGSLIIPNSVTSIGFSAFSGCSGFNGTLTISEAITSIENFVFEGCSGLTGSLKIPNSVTSIGWNAFSGCSGLTGTLTIPDSVSVINAWAFEGCKGFTGTLTIPEKVTKIEYNTFKGCEGLTSIIIPGAVSVIEDYAFNNCSGLKEVYYKAEDPKEGDSFAFSEETYWNAILYVPEAAVEKCRTIDPWKQFATIKPRAGINDVMADSSDAPACVYNLQGVLFKHDATQSDIDALPAGLYIIGGKKVYVK